MTEQQPVFPKTEIMIPMRDGIRLQTFLYLPESKTPLPALLARCMYGADRVEKKVPFWVERGYAVVLQNIRGRHKSEGGPVGREDHPEDGYDTIEWIVGQPWSNGRVGTFGRSALARVQTATAFLAHPAHRAMAPEVLPYKMMSHLGGAIMFSQIPQWMYWAQAGSDLNLYDAVDWMPHLYKLPATSVLDDVGGPTEEFKRIISDPLEVYFNDPYSQKDFLGLNTPNLMVTGWYDHCGTGPIDFYLETMKHATIMQKENTHLIIGPWDHTAAGDEAKEYDFGVEGNLDHKSLAADFFDMHLKQKEDATLPPVKIFVMGRNVWRDEKEWPLSRAKTQNLFLHSSGNVRGAWQRGSLFFESPGEEKPDSFVYDPSNPVPSWGGANSYPAKSLPMKRGPRDQRITLYRDDVLSYFSKPLEQPIEVTGPLKLILYAASSAVDTDFTAKLMDVSTDGDARLLTDGVVRARYRNGPEKESFIEPGKVYRYEIDLWNTSNEFQAGHRIGLAISSSNFPRIDRNLNTGGNYGTESNIIEAEQTIFHNEQYPSHLILPVIRN